MIKLIPLLEQEQEKEKPSHFGGGKNITVKGYETQHFDICQSAVMLFEKLDKVDNDLADGYIKKAAKNLDHLFEMEKQVVNGEELDHDPIEHSVELCNIASFQLGVVGGIIGDNFERDTSFIKLHVMVIFNRKDDIKIKDKVEEKLNIFLEKNVPTNPSKWSYYKSQAKKKFDVYPSAYANAWAAKQYKAAGGSWRKEK
tara:strand:- start:667 stop:1263 length:597 start_codon:yes stop_codon:yes gene_type:complete